MAIIETASLPWFNAARFASSLDVSESGFQGFYTGNRQRQSTLSDRLTGVLTLPASTDLATHASRDSLLMALRSAGDYLRMPPPHRRVPVGTLRGSPTVAANVLAGARSLTLSNARAGGNLLRSTDVASTVLSSSWTTSNASITANAVTDPNGTTTGWLLNRTATGNHFAYTTLTLATTELRTVAAYVWIKSGTLTGNVILRLRDGSGATDLASVSVTPNSTWTPYRIAGTFGSGTAANVQLYIDPQNDTGSAGDNLQVWFAETRVLSGFDTLCTALFDADSAPSGLSGPAEVVTRTGSGNAYSLWAYTTTSHANRTFTFSAWLKAGTFAGSVILRVRDGANVTDIATSTLALSGAWQRISVTATFGASPAANIIVFLDQTDAGSVGETFSRYGVQLEVGSAATTHYPWPTAHAGDFIGIGGNLLMVGPAGAVGDVSGAITIPLTLPAPKAITAGAVVTTEGPTGLWEWDGDSPQVEYSPGSVQGPIVIPLRQVAA